MRLSVVIPCYKDSKTLARAIDSVLIQSRNVDEIIVVNDSSPESREIQEVMCNYPQVRYIVNAKNLGLAATRNVGVEASTGTIVSFLDADDVLHPQKIELQCAVFKEGMVISCNNIRFTNENDINFNIFSPIFETKKYTKISQLLLRNRVTGASILISKKDFLKMGGYDPNLRSCEDYDFNLRCLHNKMEIVNVELPLYFYRINLSGLSQNYNQISKWEMTVVEKNLKILLSENLRHLAADYIISFWLFKHMIRYERTLDAELYLNIHKNIKSLVNSDVMRILLKVVLGTRILRIIYFLKISK